LLILLNFGVAGTLLGWYLSLREYRDKLESAVRDHAAVKSSGKSRAGVHRAVNGGEQPYEQVTIFLLDHAEAVSQPTEK